MAKQIVEVFNKTTTRIKSIAFHPTNPVIITSNHCGTVYIWNYLYQQIVAVLHEHAGSVRVVKMHPSGEFFATAGDDKIVRIWNYKTRKVAKTLKGHTDYVRCLDFHPTKPWIITGSDDCSIKIWNFYTGEMLSTSCGHTHYIMSVLFLDSTHILTASLDHTMGLWNCSNLFEKKKFLVPDVVVCQIIEAHDRGVNCLYLANGKVISGSDDREIKVWTYSNESLTLDKALCNHEGNVNAVYYDGETIYGGGEDNILSSFRKGKTDKMPLDCRIWCINGRDDCMAVGTDNGLIFYRKTFSLAHFTTENNIFYSIGLSVYKYNSKQTLDLFNTKEEIQSMFKRDELLYALYDNRFEIFRDSKKEGGDIGSLAFVGKDKYQLKSNTLFKNDVLYRSDINGKLESNDNCLIIIDKKAVTRIINDNELSSTFNFTVKSIKFGVDKIAVIGQNKILIVDFDFNVLETINELVEITGGFFHEDLFIYTTLKHIKFFYQGTGILQSIDSYSVPVCINENYLMLLTANGIEKILLNMSEIRFRRAVFKDENILSVIEDEQLPGLSPLEYLISKNKGGIALPYIKNDDKRFQLFVSDGNFDEALKLCSNPKMTSELAFAALKAERFDISEICFKKNQDNLNLFYLFLSTKQLEKMKDLEGDDIENMVKIILDDSSVLPFENLESSESNVNNKKVDAKNSNCSNDLISNMKSLKIEGKEALNSSDVGSKEVSSYGKSGAKTLSKAQKTANSFDNSSLMFASREESFKKADRTTESILKADNKINDKKHRSESSEKIKKVVSESVVIKQESESSENVKSEFIESSEQTIQVPVVINQDSESSDKINSEVSSENVKSEILIHQDSESSERIESKILIKEESESSEVFCNKPCEIKSDEESENETKAVNEESEDEAEGTKTLTEESNDNETKTLTEESSENENKAVIEESSEKVVSIQNASEESNDKTKTLNEESNENKNANGESSENETKSTIEESKTLIEESNNFDLNSDLATCNDSDLQIFDISKIKIDDSVKVHDYTVFYQQALDFTTQGKFIKAIEHFKTTIAIIAIKINQPSDFLEIRKRIGNYFLGLYVEKNRKLVEDPVLSVQMSMFFGNLDLELIHVPLVKNLALTTCFKNGNFKTAKKIAKDFPMCRNSKKVLDCEQNEDAFEVISRPFFYGTLEFEESPKECALCGVKSRATDSEICAACGIGCLH